MDVIGERLIPQERGRQVKDVDDTTIPTEDLITSIISEITSQESVERTKATN